MVQAQARGFSVARTKVGTNNPIRCTGVAAMAVDGDFVFFRNLCLHGNGLYAWRWLDGHSTYFLSQAMHGPVTISEHPMEH